MILDKKQFLNMSEIKNGLSFIDPEIKKYGVYFMMGIKQLNENDFQYLYEKIKENYCCDG